MIEWLREVRAVALDAARDFDPSVVSSTDAAAVVKEVAACEKAFAALRVLAAGRATEGGEWRRSGAGSAAEWLAGATGTTRADATQTLETSEKLASAPATEQALRAGELSEQQAAAITAAAADDPSCEGDLLALAGRSNVEQLRKTSRERRAAARPDDERAKQARVHADRYLRTWCDPDGGFNGAFRLPAAAGAEVKAVLDAHHDRLFAQARQADRREAHRALQADALVAMARAASGGAGRGDATPVTPTMIVRVDLPALVRGRTEAGETCSIDGIGPIPAAVARSMWARAVIAALAVDGPRITDLRIVGRSIPRALRLALVARDQACVVAGCGATAHLEIHHLDPVANGGPTSLDNLARICSWHHDQITYNGATLAGPPGRWAYEPPAYGNPDDPVGGPFDDGFTDIDARRAPPPAA